MAGLRSLVNVSLPWVGVHMTGNTAALEVNDFSVKDIGVNWVVTDLYGMLLEASREAADMLNLSVTGLRSRQLLVFFDGEREHWRQALHAAAAGLMVDREGAVRPRDKRPRQVRAEIVKAPDRRDGDALLWTFTEPASSR
jgi:PAS domain-containing protein